MSEVQVSSKSLTRRISDRYQFDRSVVAILALTVIIQGASVMLVQRFDLSSLELFNGQTSNPVQGIRMVGLIVVESLILIGIWRLYKSSPELLKTVVKYAWKVAVAGSIIAALVFGGLVGRLLVVCLVASLGFYKLLEYVDLDYLIHNGVALFAGIGVTIVVGQSITPSAVIPFLVAVMIWDYVAVDLSDLMGDLVSLSGSVGLPNYFIIPSGLTVDSERVDEYITGNSLSDEAAESKPDDVASIIGLGDFVLPGLLTVSAVTTIGDGLLSYPALGVLGGTCVAVFELHVAMNSRESGAPALLWLNSGALAGFFIGVLAAGVPIMTALGVSGL